VQFRRLGDSGLKLSEIGLGGWLTFGNVLTGDAARAVLDKALDLGINFLDNANVYSGGGAEEAWGEMLAGRARSSYVLATKVFFPMGKGPNDQGLSRKHIMEQCHASLKRLRTDYIDLYQCHRHDDNTPLEETVRAMDDLIHQGKVLYWGFSEWPVEQVERCLKICGDRYYMPRSSQPRYNLLARDWERELFPLCAKVGIGQVTFSPLAQGVLSGKYKPGQTPPPESRARDDRQNQFIKRTLEMPDVLSKVQRLSAIAHELDVTVSQLALAWILRRSEVTSCIVGATRPQQLEENAEASGIVLEPAVVQRVEEIFA
jgi:aryl-alcohol dehydrogenase-like predicted oxidoreductase